MGIFWGVFIAIYLLARGIIFLCLRKNIEGIGFGDVIVAGILGTIFPHIVPCKTTIEWVFLLSCYLLISSLI